MRVFRRIGRRGACTAAATACTATGIAVVTLAVVPVQPPPPRPPEFAQASVDPAPQRDRSKPSALPRSEPVRITIPKIGLRTRVETVATARDGSVAMPSDPGHAAWYDGSSTPGEPGNSVVVGHLDSRTGPAAFYGLGSLRPGDSLSLVRRDGSTARFAVERMKVWPKDAFPSRRVLGQTPNSRLTLVTCATWDPERKTYRSNLVITARPQQ